MINGPRAVVIQIQTGGFTDAAAWGWLVPPGARLTLLDEAHAKPGYIWVPIAGRYTRPAVHLAGDEPALPFGSATRRHGSACRSRTFA